LELKKTCQEGASRKEAGKGIVRGNHSPSVAERNMGVLLIARGREGVFNSARGWVHTDHARKHAFQI